MLLGSSPGAAKTRPSGIQPSIQQVNVPLTAWIASRPHALPNTLPSFETPSGRAAAFHSMLEALVARHWAKAAAQAKSIAYQLVAIREGGSTFIAASDDSGTGRDPTVLLNLNARRDFVVELLTCGSSQERAVGGDISTGPRRPRGDRFGCPSLREPNLHGLRRLRTEVCGSAQNSIVISLH